MAKYKVKHTSIMHNKKVYGEGSVIELKDEQAIRLADFVELIPETKTPSQQKPQTSKTNKKAETPAKEDGNESQEGETGTQEQDGGVNNDK